MQNTRKKTCTHGQAAPNNEEWKIFNKKIEIRT